MIPQDSAKGRESKDPVTFYKKIINDFYLSLSKAAMTIPFSGEYWLEQVTQGVGERVYNEFINQIDFSSRKSVDICLRYISLLEREGFLKAGDYEFSSHGRKIRVTINREGCVYQQFCQEARKEKLFFNCPRLAALQVVLKKATGQDYSSKVQPARDICRGTISPVERTRQEIVTREGNSLKIAGQRAIFLPLQTYASLLKAIKEHAPHILRQVLYETGYTSAQDIADKTLAIYNDPRECLSALLNELTRSGLGKIELVMFNPEEAKAVIRCYDSFQVAVVEEYESLYRTPRAVCDLLRGTFAAYLSTVLDTQIICEEMQCQSMGGAFCEFIALPL